MPNTIDFAIDLGTTNSLIARFDKGSVEVFKNPNGFRETLPSIVGFRNDRILVGDQARVYAEKDPSGVVSRFKRKMGTTESFRIKALNQSKTPIDLSAFVLKELKTFVHTGESPQAVVITIPASFDLVQSNATKDAGYAAGFKQVVLLQEPIAASLAYANREKTVDLTNTQWIVYDLGGGTFDVALVRIVEGELKVVDHEGDNYLGGSDFDELVVEKLIAPALEKKGRFTNLVAQMKSESGRHNRLWYRLLHVAEQAKIELSAKTSADIDVSAEDEDGNEIELSISITRSDFEAVIKDAIDSTAEMLKKILTRHSLLANDIKFVLMVGGATYTPFVRKRIEELLRIPINTGIDPTNAIAVGAAYYAGTKDTDATHEIAAKSSKAGTLRIKTSYNRASQEKEEMFSAKVEGDVAGRFYRITRHDGGYDSGLKPLSARLVEDLPLQEGTYNLFAFTVYDARNNPVPTDFDSIQIAQGKYAVAGQMLPEDLSLVRDDLNTGDTKLDRIFAKNAILPAKAKRTVDVSKTVVHGSDDEIRIIVVEGPSENHFTANKTVGHLTISGKKLKQDLLRGTEIDLAFEHSESRDLTVHAYVNPSGPEFSQIFKGTYRDVPVNTLIEEVEILNGRMEQEKVEALANENYEAAEKLEQLRVAFRELQGETMLLALDDVTTDRYKLEDRKRRIAQELNHLTAGKRMDRLRAAYQSTKDEVSEIVNESGNDPERRQFSEIVAQEHAFLNSQTPQKVEEKIAYLRRVKFQILRRTPAFLVAWFEHLVSKRETFNDQVQAKSLIEAAKRHVAAEDYDSLAEVNTRLHNLLPQQEQDTTEMRHFTGIT